MGKSVVLAEEEVVNIRPESDPETLYPRSKRKQLLAEEAAKKNKAKD